MAKRVNELVEFQGKMADALNRHADNCPDFRKIVHRVFHNQSESEFGGFDSDTESVVGAASDGISADSARDQDDNEPQTNDERETTRRRRMDKGKGRQFD